MNSSILAVFEHRNDAESLLHFLEERGVVSALTDLTVEKPGNAITRDFAKYQVRISTADQERAFRATHQSAQGIQLLRTAVHCPECGSCRVIYPHQPHNFLIPAFFRLMVKLRILDGSYLCLVCKHEWSPRKNANLN